MWAVVTPGRSRAIRKVTQTLEPGHDPLEWRPAGGQVVRRRQLSGRGAQERLDEAVVAVDIRGAVARHTARSSLALARTCAVGGVRSSASSNEADVTAARSDA